MKVRLSYKLPAYQEFSVWCNPISRSGKLKTILKNESLIFQDTFEGSLFFYNSEREQIYDYDVIRALPKECTYIWCEIYNVCCEMNTDAKPDFVGYFTTYMGKYDDNRKTFEVTPKSEVSWNTLNNVLEKEINVNTQDQSVWIPLVAGRGAFMETADYIIPSVFIYDLLHQPGDGAYIPYDNGNYIQAVSFFIDTINDYLIQLINTAFDFSEGGTRSSMYWWVDRLFIYITQTVSGDPDGSLTMGDVTIKMSRTITWTFMDSTGSDVQPDSSGLWWPELHTYIGGIPATKWIRRYPYSYMSQAELEQGTPLTTLLPVYYGMFMDSSTGDIQIHSNPPTDNNVVYKHGRLLVEVINYLLQGSGLTFESRLLQDVNSPLTGQVNKYKELYLIQKSDAINPGDSMQATDWKMTLKDILDDLKLIFNADYDVIGNKVVFEHTKYWERGKSYTQPKTVQLDMTSNFAEYLVETNAWTYSLDQQPRKERFTFYDAKTPDWQPEDIAYNMSCTADNTKQYSTKILTTDLMMCQMLEQDSHSGFILVACQGVDSNGNHIIPFGASYFGLAGAANMNLSWSILIPEFHFYNRLYKKGSWMSLEVVFESYRKYREQKQIDVPLCCEHLSPYKLVETYLGDGEIKELTYDLTSGVTSMILLYDYE